MERFNPIENFASIKQCCCIFSWLVPQVSYLSVWQNGKQPMCFSLLCYLFINLYISLVLNIFLWCLFYDPLMIVSWLFSKLV